MTTQTRSVLLAFLLLTSFVTSAAEDYKAGASWLRLTEDSRLMWVWGATQGQDLIFEEQKDLKLTTFIRLPSGQADVIAKIMTQYYGDAANTYIPWKYMAVVAAMKLTGAPDSKLNDQLTSLRQYATWARDQQNGQEKK